MQRTFALRTTGPRLIAAILACYALVAQAILAGAALPRASETLAALCQTGSSPLRPGAPAAPLMPGASGHACGCVLHGAAPAALPEAAPFQTPVRYAIAANIEPKGAGELPPPAPQGPAQPRAPPTPRV